MTAEEFDAVFMFLLDYADALSIGQTSSQRAKRALLRDMLIDLGVDITTVYELTQPLR
jgi:hypothetical protein